MTLVRSWTIIGVLFLGSLIGSSTAVAQLVPPSAPNQTTSGQSDLSIGPGDLLDLVVYDVPELVLKVRVDFNGMVTLPLIGDLRLGGRTVREAQQLIAHELVAREMVKQPQVSLLVVEFATQGIAISGEVNQAGIYPLIGPHRLSDAIAAAGGLTLKAGHTITILHANRPNDPQVITLQPGVPIEELDVTISPGDRIVVSKAGVVYVVGEVTRPGAFLMENNSVLTVIKAIALAGGTTKVANTKHVIVMGRDQLGKTGNTPAAPSSQGLPELRLDDIYKHRISDPLLQAEDIVYVPTSGAKVYGTIALQGSIQAAVASIYVFPRSSGR